MDHDTRSTILRRGCRGILRRVFLQFRYSVEGSFSSPLIPGVVVQKDHSLIWDVGFAHHAQILVSCTLCTYSVSPFRWHWLVKCLASITCSGRCIFLLPLSFVRRGILPFHLGHRFSWRSRSVTGMGVSSYNPRAEPANVR